MIVEHLPEALVILLSSLGLIRSVRGLESQPAGRGQFLRQVVFMLACTGLLLVGPWHFASCSEALR